MEKDGEIEGWKEKWKEVWKERGRKLREGQKVVEV